MSKITAFRCDFCELPKDGPELTGFHLIEGQLKEQPIEKASKHICFKCSKNLGEMADRKLRKKMTGSNFRSC